MAKKIKVFAPGRVELLGNHTDYNEGYVLSFAIDRGVTLTGSLRDDQQIIFHARDLGERYEGSVTDIKPSSEQPWVNYLLGVVAEFLARRVAFSGCEIEITSDLPIGAGLGSSGALETALACFLQEALHTSFSLLELAQIGQKAEHTYVGVKCGPMDQISSLFSKQHHLNFIDCRTYEMQHIPLNPDVVFVVANTHIKHALVDGEYNERRKSCQEAAQFLGLKSLRDASRSLLGEKKLEMEPRFYQRAFHVVGENERVLLAAKAIQQHDMAGLGQLMFESHNSSRLYFENSCPELDSIVQLAVLLRDCWGARLSGGGFGGAVIAVGCKGFEEDLIWGILATHPDVECLSVSPEGGARVITDC